MDDSRDTRAAEGGDSGGEGTGAGGGAPPPPPRPSREGLPPSDGEVAARRLIYGHLDTSDLDPVSARAVELLAYADLVATEAYVPHPRRLWHDPLWWAVLSVLVCLVLISTALLVIVRRADESDEQRNRIETISRQVKSCVEPAGECAKRGQDATAAAVAALNRATAAIVKCADQYDGEQAIDACVARVLRDTDR